MTSGHELWFRISLLSRQHFEKQKQAGILVWGLCINSPMMDVNLLVCVNAFALFRVLCGRRFARWEFFFYCDSDTEHKVLMKLKAQGVNVKLGVSFPAKPPWGMLWNSSGEQSRNFFFLSPHSVFLERFLRPTEVGGRKLEKVDHMRWGNQKRHYEEVSVGFVVVMMRNQLLSQASSGKYPWDRSAVNFVPLVNGWNFLF